MLLCPWDSPGKNTRVGCHALLQGIFLSQGSNLRLLWLLRCGQILYQCTIWEAPNLGRLRKVFFNTLGIGWKYCWMSVQVCDDITLELSVPLA